jgi:LysM repeat protein
VIINGELETGLGGGVCQVSTTVFNAAYEGGLKITARTNHALYISHYPQGRDATVDYPDVDLRFVNDTKHWLLLRTFVGSSSLTVTLYGTPVDRKVVSETSPLVETGPPPVKRIEDPTLLKGQEVVDESGSPSLATSVHRRVYTKDGKLLYDDRWYSSYRGETRVVRVGTKPKPKPKPKPAPPHAAPRPAPVPVPHPKSAVDSWVTVHKGDTLSSIAARYPQKNITWQSIYNANRKTVGSNPNLIRVGQRIHVTG